MSVNRLVLRGLRRRVLGLFYRGVFALMRNRSRFHHDDLRHGPIFLLLRCWMEERFDQAGTRVDHEARDGFARGGAGRRFVFLAVLSHWRWHIEWEVVAARWALRFAQRGADITRGRRALRSLHGNRLERRASACEVEAERHHAEDEDFAVHGGVHFWSRASSAMSWPVMRCVAGVASA